MSNENNFVQTNGIMSQGYGFSPKIIMRDTRLTVEAKAIYAYMSSFAGAGLSAFPSVELQMYELGMAKNRYYKHRKLLEKYGYITIKQTRKKNKDGKSINDKNIYTLEQFPVEKEENSEILQNDEAQKDKKNEGFSEIHQNEDTQNEDTQNEDTQNEDTNSKSVVSNKLNNNSANISSSNNEDIKQMIKLSNNRLNEEEVNEILFGYSKEKLIKAIIKVNAVARKQDIHDYYNYIVATVSDLETTKTTNINIVNKEKNRQNFTGRGADYYASLEDELRMF